MKSGAMAVALLLTVLPFQAQEKKPLMIAEDGGYQERGSARVLYWDTRANMAFGQFAIEYGRPVWKKEYDDAANFDKLTKGKIYRLGSNFWTALDTQLSIRISGREVSPGHYYLGLARSADGSTWSLAFIDSAKTRSMHLDAFQIDRAPVLFHVPMTAEPSGKTTEKLTITCSYTKEKPKDVTVRILWGKLRLAAPVEVKVGP